MTPRELNDKEMAIRLIQGMDKRTSLQTIINRLASVQSAVAMAGMLVGDGMLTEELACEWLVKVLRQYEPEPPPPSPYNQSFKPATSP